MTSGGVSFRGGFELAGDAFLKRIDCTANVILFIV